MLFNDKECQILTLRDTSADENLKHAKKQNELLHLLTSSVSHELITPIKCMIAFANDLLDLLKDKAALHKSKIIANTGKLLLT
jgi:signal transduction histidine kinase